MIWHKKGIRGRLITSNYLDFNQPKVFKELLKLPNVDVRIINENGFHTKAYSFNHGDYTSVIIGSANLTQTALKRILNGICELHQLTKVTLRNKSQLDLMICGIKQFH